MGVTSSRVRFRFFSRDMLALFYALRDPAAPWRARLLAILAILYALSPIDLIPDVIPVLGLLDDIVLLPLGMALAFRLMPDTVAEAARAKSHARATVLKRIAVFMLVAVLAWIAITIWNWR